MSAICFTWAIAKKSRQSSADTDGETKSFTRLRVRLNTQITMATFTQHGHHIYGFWENNMDPITRDEVIELIRRHEIAAGLVSAVGFPIVLLCGILVGIFL